MNRLECFLYMLMRDEIVLGEIERLVYEVEKVTEGHGSNKHLAAYAKEIATRLT